MEINKGRKIENLEKKSKLPQKNIQDRLIELKKDLRKNKDEIKRLEKEYRL